MMQAVGWDVLGIGKFTKKAAKTVNKKVLRPVGKVVGKVARNPVVQVMNPALAIGYHTSSKALGGKGTIKGVAGRVVDAGAGVATSKAKLSLPKLALPKVALPKLSLPKLALPKVGGIPWGTPPGKVISKGGMAHLKAAAGRVAAPKTSAGPASSVRTALKSVTAAKKTTVKMRPAAVKLTSTVKPPSSASVAKAKAAYPMAHAITKKNVAIKMSRPAPSATLIGNTAAAAASLAVFGAGAAKAAAAKPAAAAAAKPAAAPAAAPASITTQDGFFIPRTGVDAGRVIRTGRNAGRVA
jgi:hypothetical protein